MQRGIVTFTKSEIEEMLRRINRDAYMGTPMMAKLTSGINTQAVDIDVELSEEELEDIMDEIIIPSAEDNEMVKSVRHKIQEKLESFRKEVYAR